MASVVHIWQLVLRHAELFYPSRGQFVGQMVHTISKLALQVRHSLTTNEQYAE